MLFGHFTFRDIAELKNDVQLKFIIFFQVQNSDGFVNFSDGFSQPRVETVLDRVLTPILSLIFTSQDSDGLEGSICCHIACGVLSASSRPLKSKRVRDLMFSVWLEVYFRKEYVLFVDGVVKEWLIFLDLIIENEKVHWLRLLTAAQAFSLVTFGNNLRLFLSFHL